MIKFTFEKNDSIFSDGKYCSNGMWICDLEKIPLGELLMDNIDIVCGEGNQMRLIDYNPITQRNFKDVVPDYYKYEMRNSGFVYENPLNKTKYRMFINYEEGLIAFINENYIKVFKGVKTESVSTNGQGQMLQFRDEEDEFVFGIMPADLKDEIDMLDELIERFKKKKQVLPQLPIIDTQKQ